MHFNCKQKELSQQTATVPFIIPSLFLHREKDFRLPINPHIHPKTLHPLRVSNPPALAPTASRSAHH